MRIAYSVIGNALVLGGLMGAVLAPSAATASSALPAAGARAATVPTGAAAVGEDVRAGVARACATPCSWVSAPVSTQILALKAAELKAQQLAQVGYTILTTAAKAEQDAATWRGHVTYR
ncbi:hypothetical protein ABZU32_16170 [Sphaerisporangium sp. NPDC005288]|uniref:hypothetical protein n=1 Tax=Sphaerisporangium sp. NPDC005288 TaxID=3155114 RepID=UPI0033A53E96